VNDLRKKLIDYVRKNGVKYRYVAKQLGVSNSMLSHYIAQRKNLSHEKLVKLKKIIEC